MDKGSIAVFDPDEEYAKKLAAYIRDKYGRAFFVSIFSNIQSLRDFEREHEIDVLVVDSNSMSEDIRELHAKGILMLSDGRIITDYMEMPTVYKYQEAGKVLKEIVSEYLKVRGDDEFIFSGKEKSVIVGVYNPPGSVEGFTLSDTICRYYSKSSRVLYLNLTEFSTLSGEEPGRDNISDLMYYYMQSRKTVSLKLSSIALKRDGYDYVVPSSYPADLRNVETKMWTGLIDTLSLSGDYDVIVVEFENIIADIFNMMDICDSVFVQVRDEDASMQRLSAFEEYLMKSGREDIAFKMIKVLLPGEYDQREEFISRIINDDRRD